MKFSSNIKMTLHFSIQLAEDGSIVDSTRDKQPVSFVLGDGNLLPSFEKLLLGLQVNDKRSFVLQPKQGFGEYNEANFQAIPRTQFSADMKLEVGLLIGFSDASGEELPGLVKSINEQFIMIDFNHPLAGKELIFEVEILALEPLNAETLINWIEKTDRRYSTL